MRPVTLNPNHVPAEIRGLLEEFQGTHEAAAGLAKQLTVAPMADRAELQEQHDRAAAPAAAAYTALEDATRACGPQMRAAAVGAFCSAVERARARITEAEAELREAAQAAALFASIRDGKATVSTDTDRAARSVSRQHCMRLVSDLREVLGDLPDGIDN